jgi:5-methylcytosine-specific restriction endonuclease McrA
MTEYLIQQVWEKGRIIPGYDSNVWRKDQCSAWIGRKYYGDRNSQYGWEIHHIVPVDRGGSDYIWNLIPLQWENNVATGDSGSLVCRITG